MNNGNDNNKRKEIYEFLKYILNLKFRSLNYEFSNMTNYNNNYDIKIIVKECNIIIQKLLFLFFFSVILPYKDSKSAKNAMGKKDKKKKSKSSAIIDLSSNINIIIDVQHFLKKLLEHDYHIGCPSSPVGDYDSIMILQGSLKDLHIILNELHFDSGEQRQLNELLFKGSSESPVPKIVGLAEFLTSAIPIISSSFELLFDRYCKIPNLSKSVDVVLIRHNDNTGSSSISTKDESCPSSSINDESGESLVDTTLSILKMLLLGFISFLFVRKGKIPA
ncbi:hypothetical protein H8356DRAFT_1356354 [Neocallimastix lanati (nom. inval.)]|nr:hypothetical protein H8356DRAFT_1356354 [Neocallimastix sp. JGI-2020a]